jgi:hypothetical protein
LKRLVILTSLCIGFLALTTFTSAQKAPPASPAAKAEGIIGGKSISIAYSSPGVKGRAGQLFGKGGRISHDPKYPVWRAGANSATTLVADGTFKIGDIMVPKGTYTLFVDVSDPDQWVLIVSKKTGEWGLAYDSTQDLGRTKMNMSKPPSTIENLTWQIVGKDDGLGTITLSWENHVASVPVAAA